MVQRVQHFDSSMYEYIGEFIKEKYKTIFGRKGLQMMALIFVLIRDYERVNPKKNILLET